MTAARLPAKGAAPVVTLSRTPTADRLAEVLRDPRLALGLGTGVAHLPALADVETATRELTTALASRPTAQEVRKVVGTLALSYPQQAKPEAPEVYVAALESEAAGYPLDVLKVGARAVLRSCRFLPTVAELVEACEAEMRERSAILRNAEYLAREIAERQERQREEERREAERAALRQRQEADIRARWGDLVPSWFTIRHAERGVMRAGHPALRIEGRAAEGDGPTLVMLRRGALFGLALELHEVTPTKPRHLRDADLDEIAELLVNGRDAEAAAIVEAALETPRACSDEPKPVSWARIAERVLWSLEYQATRATAEKEGLPELPHDPKAKIEF